MVVVVEMDQVLAMVVVVVLEEETATEMEAVSVSKVLDLVEVVVEVVALKHRVLVMA